MDAAALRVSARITPTPGSLSELEDHRRSADEPEGRVELPGLGRARCADGESAPGEDLECEKLVARLADGRRAVDDRHPHRLQMADDRHPLSGADAGKPDVDPVDGDDPGRRSVNSVAYGERAPSGSAIIRS